MAVDLDVLRSAGLVKSADVQKADTRTDNQLAQADFLKLMTTQLQAQDPTKPQDGAEFMSQMAQFGAVDGIDKLNKTMEGFGAMLTGGQAMQATALVGREVLTDQGGGFLAGTGNLKGVVDLPSSALNVQVKVSNASGALVRTIPIGTLAGGQSQFAWDGLTDAGARAAPGNYQIQATGIMDGKTVSVPTLTSAKVNSVSVGSGNNVMLNIEGIGALPFNQIQQIQ